MTTLTQSREDTLGRSDHRAIHQIAERFVSAWNAGDSTGIAALFAEDADFINILGAHDHGRAAIEAVHRYIFDTVYKGSRNHYSVESMRFVRPDIAVMVLRAHLTYSAIEAVGEIDARPTMVLAKDNGEWNIVVFQNTKIAAPTVRSGADL